MPAAPAKRRPPAAYDPLSPHSIRVTIVRKLVSPAALKASKTAWGRELAILKKLQKTYNSDDFWLTLAPAEPLETWAWVIAPYGAAALREQWNLYAFGRAQDQITLDAPSSRLMMEGSGEEMESAPVLVRKQTPIDWADSDEELHAIFDHMRTLAGPK